MPQNVLIVVLDTARADALEPYGAPAGSSPVIADLARRGSVMRSTFATASWTLPSHASMFTGLLPREAGILDLQEGSPLAARPVIESHRDRLLPEVLRRAGYSTAAVSTNLWVAPVSGFGVGFDTFEAVDTGRQGRIHRESLRSRARWDAESVLARVDDGARSALEALRRMASGPPAKPFFWFVNLVECHSPYLPPKPYNDLGPLDRLRAAEEARRYLTMGAIWKACAGAFEVPAETLERMRHLYRRSVRQLDDWLGSLLDELDRSALLDETLVIVTSDHGENFGENGYMAHAFSLDDRLIRVPLIAAG
ncbi:MAG: sulfatase, partial [Solirubrobacterales bacterium]